MPRKQIRNWSIGKEKILSKALSTLTFIDSLIKSCGGFCLQFLLDCLTSSKLAYLGKLRPVGSCHFVVCFYVCALAPVGNPMIIEPSAGKLSSCNTVNKSITRLF